MPKSKIKLAWSFNWLIVLTFSLNASAWSETRIAILDFELKDLTLIPGTPAELARTASIKTLLEEELASAGYQIIAIDKTAQHQANSGFGYLFDHHDSAAKLGETFAADYVLVGRLHKPSFLFAYLMGHLINVESGQLIGNFITESKGGDKKLTRKAVEAMVVEIDALLEKRYSPPTKNKQ